MQKLTFYKVTAASVSEWSVYCCSSSSIFCAILTAAFYNQRTKRSVSVSPVGASPQRIGVPTKEEDVLKLIRMKMNGRGGFLNSVTQAVWQYPIISAALLCFACVCFTTGAISQIDMIAPSLGVFVLGVAASVKMTFGQKEKQPVSVLIALMMFSAALAAFFGVTVVSAASPGGALLNFGMAVIAGVFIYLGIHQKLDTPNMAVLIAAAGFLLRLTYVMSFTIGQHQHDVSSINSAEGHIGYIEYLYSNGHLPDFDVRNVYQFYHAPLHHIIAAVWLRYQILLGVRYENACENIQVLTLFYSTASMILSYKIFRKLKLRGKGLLTAFAVVAFCPTFIIMAGSINNDILSITFMLGAILYTLKWYENRRFKNIIPIALCIGFGMFTKLSVWMVAPPVAFVFIYVFFRNLNRKDIKKHLAQFAVFAVICVPIGLFWSVRNLLLFDVPLTYVPMLSETSKQYIGHVSVWKRLFSLDPVQFENVGDQFIMYGGKYNEYNPLIALFKTSVFDEGFNSDNYPEIAGFHTILFWAAAVLGLIGFGAMIFLLLRKKCVLDIPTRIFVASLYAVIAVSYYVFCFRFPHVCTENIRYAVPLIVIGAYFIGLLMQTLSQKDSGRLQHIFAKVLCQIVIIYGASSALVYDMAMHHM